MTQSPGNIAASACARQWAMANAMVMPNSNRYTVLRVYVIPCHCEERSNEAISCMTSGWVPRQRFASSLRSSQ
jgi:hypothetical protein